MIETNVRILAPGRSIAMPVRYARINCTTDAPELREKVCYRLRSELRLVAFPCQEDRHLLLVATSEKIVTRRFIIDEWEVELADAGIAMLLTLDTPEGKRLLPELVERLITGAIEQRGLWWSFDSLRLWYEQEPFDIQRGIRAFRRYAISAFAIEGVGIGVSVDPETAFFTENSVAWFFDSRVPANEQAQRRRQFDYLTRRQLGQYGTLLYDNGINQLKCYFKEMPKGRTCGNTKPPRVRRQSYTSMVDYYHHNSPDLQVDRNTPVAMVAFNNLKGSQPVAADRLWLRVMNDGLPNALVNVDKIKPTQRCSMVEAFWDALGLLSFPQIRDSRKLSILDGSPNTADSSIGFETIQSELEYENSNRRVGSMKQASLTVKADDCTFLPGFWCPEAERVRQIPIPTLYFRNGMALPSPTDGCANEYKRNYRRRLELLKEAGAYNFPHIMKRELVCPYPDGLGLDEAAEEMMEGITGRLGIMTGKTFTYSLLPYKCLEDAVSQLELESPSGAAVFVLNDEAEAYADVAIGLKNWKVKRVTWETLRKKYRDLEQQGRGSSSWNGFLRMMMLDVFQEMDGIPFRVDHLGAFEAQLVIDVSHDRRYYALSLLIMREVNGKPDFRLITDVLRKADIKETINGRVLRDDIVRLVSRIITPGKDAPLTSLLIPRDGKLVGNECSFIENGVEELRQRGRLTPEACVEIMELHKNTEINLRLWERHADGQVTNVLEGTAVRIDDRTEVLTTTGAGTLTQGTAEPLMIHTREGGNRISDITDSLAISAQLNWSNPSVAQRLPLPFKRTDEELKSRAEEEIRRSR